MQLLGRLARRVAIGATLLLAMAGAAAGVVGFLWPGALRSEGRLAFVPLVALALVGLFAWGVHLFPAETPTTRPAPDPLFAVVVVLTLMGVVTAVVGMVAMGGYSPTSLPQCRWALTYDHGLTECTSHPRWLRATVGNGQFGIGVATAIAAVACGFVNTRARVPFGRPRRSLRGYW